MLSAALGLAIAGVAASVLLGEHGVAHLLRLRAERRALGQTAFVLMERNARLRARPSGPQPSSSPDANSSYSSASIRSSSSASSWSLISTSHPSW